MKLTSIFGITYFEGSIDELKFVAESEGLTVKQYQDAHKNDGKSASKPSVSGKSSSTRVTLTAEEREAKKAEKVAERKAERKEWFDGLTETEQKQFVNYKAFGRVLRDAYTKASADLVGSTLKGEDRKTKWGELYSLYIISLCESNKLNKDEAERDYKAWKEAHPKKK